MVRRAAHAVKSFAEHPILNIKLAAGAAQLLGVGGTIAVTEAPAKDAALLISAVGAIGVGLASGSDVAVQFLIGGYAGAVLGMGWSKGEPSEASSTHEKALRWRYRKDHSIDPDIVERLLHPDRSVDERLAAWKGLSRKEQKDILEAHGRTLALFVAMGVSGVLAVKLGGTLQAVFDQLCGGMMGPLVQSAAASNEAKTDARDAWRLAGAQAVAKAAVKVKAKLADRLEDEAERARSTAASLKGTAKGPSAQKTADKATTAATAAQKVSDEANTDLHDAEKREREHFEVMMGKLHEKIEAQKATAYEKLLVQQETPASASAPPEVINYR